VHFSTENPKMRTESNQKKQSPFCKRDRRKATNKQRKKGKEGANSLLLVVWLLGEKRKHLGGNLFV
jgi:hypothetical protein